MLVGKLILVKTRLVKKGRLEAMSGDHTFLQIISELISRTSEIRPLLPLPANHERQRWAW